MPPPPAGGHPAALPSDPPDNTPTRVRYWVLGSLCSLSFILYLDRVCIAQAVQPIKRELGLADDEMGWILAAFTIAYGLFEVPMGHWGDRYGSRGVLTRIVIWWSFFTMITGATGSFLSLLLVRFLFGAGEAGALPNSARVVARWFPVASLGSAQGCVVTSMLVGGAVAPLVTQWLIGNFGWRITFGVLGIPGIVWATLFYLWFRDDPAQHASVNPEEVQLIAAGRAPSHTSTQHAAVPWRTVLTSANVWLLGVVITCAAATTYVMFSWYPSYLQDGRGVTAKTSAWLASLVLALGAGGSLLGGRVGDELVRITGSRRWSRCGMGFVAMASAALALVGSVWCDSPYLASACCAWTCFAIQFQVAAWWGAVTDISGKHLGALFGLMNSMGVPGAAASQLLLGKLVTSLKGKGYLGRDAWDPAFYVYGGVLLFGAFLWLWIDTTKSAVDEHQSSTPEETL